jgi:hypothetical protein
MAKRSQIAQSLAKTRQGTYDVLLFERADIDIFTSNAITQLMT